MILSWQTEINKQSHEIKTESRIEWDFDVFCYEAMRLCKKESDKSSVNCDRKTKIR